MNFQKFKNTKFKSYFAVMMCVLTAIVGFCGCSFDYILNDDTADNITSGVYSESTSEESVISDKENSSISADESESEEVTAEESTTEETVVSEDEKNSDTNVTYSFRNDKLMNDHFAKHNEDFNYATVEEYVEGANRVINDENSLHKLEAEDGDDVYYLEETNEFVIVSTDGYIRTYFNPSNPIWIRYCILSGVLNLYLM